MVIINIRGNSRYDLVYPIVIHVLLVYLQMHKRNRFVDILINCAGMAKAELFEENYQTFKVDTFQIIFIVLTF